jgi:hypothetical protein
LQRRTFRSAPTDNCQLTTASKLLRQRLVDAEGVLFIELLAVAIQRQMHLSTELPHPEG